LEDASSQQVKVIFTINSIVIKMYIKTQNQSKYGSNMLTCDLTC